INFIEEIIISPWHRRISSHPSGVGSFIVIKYSFMILTWRKCMYAVSISYGQYGQLNSFKTVFNYDLFSSCSKQSFLEKLSGYFKSFFLCIEYKGSLPGGKTVCLYNKGRFPF